MKFNYFIIWIIWMLFFDVPSHSFRSIPTFSPPCEPCEWTRPRTMIYGGSDSQSDYRGLELRSTSRTTPTQPTFSLLFTCAIYLVEGWFFTTAATGSRRRRGSRRHWHCEFWWGQSSNALLKSPWIPGPSLICIWCVTPASLWVSSGGETQKQRNVKKET